MRRICLQGIDQLSSAPCHSQLHEAPRPADEARGTIQCGLQGKKTRQRKKCHFVLPSRPTCSGVNGKQNFCLLAKMPLGVEGTTHMLTMLAAENVLLPSRLRWWLWPQFPGNLTPDPQFRSYPIHLSNEFLCLECQSHSPQFLSEFPTCLARDTSKCWLFQPSLRPFRTHCTTQLPGTSGACEFRNSTPQGIF